jgi:hypothetical protein
VGGGWGCPPQLLQSTTLYNQGNAPGWMRVRSSDNTLFSVITNDAQLAAYNIASPGTPVLLGKVTLTGLTSGVAYLSCRGNYCYVTDQNVMKLDVVDTTNPASMSVVATLTYDSSGATGGSRTDISPDGHWLFIGGAESGASANRPYLVDISTPTAPTLTAQVGTAAGAIHRGVAWLSNTYVAVSSRDTNQVLVFSIATPSAPALAYTYSMTIGNTTTPMIYDASTSTLYVGQHSGYLVALNASNPTSFTYLSSAAVPSATPAVGPEQIALSGTGYALMSIREQHMYSLLNISNPSSVFLSLTVPTNGLAYGTAFSPGGGYAYGTGGSNVNGQLFAFQVNPNLNNAFTTLQNQLSSLAAGSATLGGNTYTGTQVISRGVAGFSSSVGLNMTDDGSCFQLGTTTPDTICRNAAGQITSSGIWFANGFQSLNGGALRMKTTSSSAQYTFQAGTDGNLLWSDGTNAADVRVTRTAAGVLKQVLGSFDIGTVGQGLRVAEGTNGKQVTGITLSSGTVTVANTSVTANSRILCQRTGLNGATALGILVYSVTASTSFTVTSYTSAAAVATGDTSTMWCEILEPG